MHSSAETVATRASVETLANVDVRDRAVTAKPRGPLLEDILTHLALVVIALIVLFPILWIVSMSLDPRNISRPSTLTIIPPGASLDDIDARNRAGIASQLGRPVAPGRG